MTEVPTHRIHLLLEPIPRPPITGNRLTRWVKEFSQAPAEQEKEFWGEVPVSVWRGQVHTAARRRVSEAASTADANKLVNEKVLPDLPSIIPCITQQNSKSGAKVPATHQTSEGMKLVRYYDGPTYNVVFRPGTAYYLLYHVPEVSKMGEVLGCRQDSRGNWYEISFNGVQFGKDWTIYRETEALGYPFAIEPKLTGWPSALWNPHYFKALAVLTWLLKTRGDDNFLSALCRASDPYGSTARRFAKEVCRVRDWLNTLHQNGDLCRLAPQVAIRDAILCLRSHPTMLSLSDVAGFKYAVSEVRRLLEEAAAAIVVAR